MADSSGSGEREALKGPLRALSALYGVETEHRDGFDRDIRPEPETLLVVLAALGAPVDGPDSVPEALRFRRRELAGRLLEPVSVAWSGSSSTLALGPAAGSQAPIEVRVRTEGGIELETRAAVGSPEPGRMSLPWRMEPGYHEVEVKVGGQRAQGLLLVAPHQVFGADRGSGQRPGRGREWGVFLPLYALRTGTGARAGRGDGSRPAEEGRSSSPGVPEVRDFGVGSLSGLEELLRWTGSAGGQVVGTLPLLAQYLDDPVEPSPYAPVSRLFWNELYLDPTRLPEWERTPEARELAGSDAFRAEARRLDRLDEVDYREVAHLRHRILDLLARTWMEERGESDPAFRAALRERPEMLRYADFRGTVARSGVPGEGWPDAWRPEGAPSEARDATVRLRHLYAQVRLPEQIHAVRRAGEESGAGLYLDLPLGTHPDGFDSWVHPELFARDAALGAPPDRFQAEGQDWSLPPMRPEASRLEGHRHFRELLGTLMAASDHLRIDHVMGLHRMYWVPRGMGGGEGAYVRYPAEELYAVLSLESHRHGTVVAGEDLGTVPAEVREAMTRAGLRRSYVVPFETRPDHDDGLAPVPPGAVASLGTHDLPPFAAFWKNASPEDRRALSRAAGVEGTEQADSNAVLVGLLERLGRSAAGLVLVSLEDLWLEERPQNRPGTTDPGNWRGRSRLTLEEMRGHAGVRAALETLQRTRPGGGADRERDEKSRSAKANKES